MCTLIVCWKVHREAGLILAANRDEYLERPTASPEIWRDTNPPIVAGRDLKSGGTWLATGKHVTAALTNHHSGLRSVAREKSRGDLVVIGAQATSASRAAEKIGSMAGEDFGPFHLLLTDQTEMLWLTNQAGGIMCEEVAPGFHVLGNRGLDNPEDPVVQTITNELEGACSMPQLELTEKLKTTLAREGFGWPCVRLPGYGTRSASIIWKKDTGSEFLYREGSPNEGAWEDRTALLEELEGQEP